VLAAAAQDQPRARVRYGRIAARAAAELFSAGPRDQDHYKGYGTRYFSTSWGLCKHTNDVESALIHYAISFSAPVAQLDRVPGYEKSDLHSISKTYADISRHWSACRISQLG
jgi:hypothetical protein